MPLKVHRRTKRDIFTPDVTPPRVIADTATGDALSTVGEIISDVGAVQSTLDERERVAEARRLAADEKARKALAKEQEKRDRSDATEASNTAKISINEQIQNLKKGNKLRKAAGVSSKYNAQNKLTVEEIGGKLESDFARQLFNEDMGVFSVTNSKSMLEYENSETTKGYNESATASANISVQSGIANYSSREALDTEAENIEIQSNSMMLNNDWDRNQRDQWADERISEMYFGALKLQSVDNVEAAKIQYQYVEDKILPDKRDEVQAFLKVEDTNQKGKDLAERIIINTDDLEEQKKQARNAPADVSDNAMKRIVAHDKEKKAIKSAKNLESDDGILTDILRLHSDKVGGGEAKSYELAQGASSGKVEFELQNKIKSLYKVDKTKGQPDQSTQEYSDILDGVYTGIGEGKYRSLGELRRATVALSTSDQTEVENLWQNGGLMGGVSNSEMKSAYKDFTGQDSSENTRVFMSAVRYIGTQTRALPAGRTTVGSDQLNTWMQTAVSKSADEKNWFSPDRPSVTVAEAFEEGSLADLRLDIPEDDVTRIEGKIEEENKKRVKKGLAPWPTTDTYIRKYYDNERGVTRPKRIVIPAPAPVAPEPARTEPTPFAGNIEAKTALQIQQEVKEKTGTELSHEQARRLESQQFEGVVTEPLKLPEPKATLTGLGEVEAIETKTAPEQEQSNFDAALADTLITKGAVGKEVTFEIFKEAKQLQLEREDGDILERFGKERLEGFYKEEYEEYLRNLEK